MFRTSILPVHYNCSLWALTKDRKFDGCQVRKARQLLPVFFPAKIKNVDL
jgi:hypothetical protein